MQPGAPGLIVDLTDISYIDSAGLGNLLAAFKDLARRDAKLYVISTPNNPGVRRILEITRLDTVMNVRDTVEAALDDLKTPKKQE